MKKIFVPSLMALALASVSGLVQAQTAAPESSLSFNVGAVSDYRYRGISQSRLKPALQGGVDYADKSGFYVGAWGSTIKWIKDTPGVTAGSTEVDLYGGYKGAVGDVAYDVGFLRYQYSGNNYANYGVNANTNEVYGAATFGVVTAKYSHAISNLFGNIDSKNSYYLDLSAAFDLGNGFSLTPHVGYQKIKNVTDDAGSYTDYSLTLTKDLGNGLSATAAVVGTDADRTFYTLKDKFNGKSGLVVGLKYAF
ncbi:MAG: TorF family putative porin [Pseudomonadota bacterium]|jgi:uncharacterized protein (TIGR02001 family)